MNETNMKKIFFYFFILGVLSLSSCEKVFYTPKPIAYPRIQFPEKGKFEKYKDRGCPYSFEYPTYAKIVQQKNKFTNEVESCWFNVSFEDFNATIYMSYKEIGLDITLEKVLEDAHKLTYAHSKKADFIDEALIKNKQGVKGQLSEVGGNVATNIQFYLSDLEKHYIRGSLYFQTSPNIDSVQPIVDFIKKDMTHIFETFKWK
tara:strand:- start:1246 stop:1854 length:609 start_codon:yes stop_codon:yes gene_type:complete